MTINFKKLTSLFLIILLSGCMHGAIVGSGAIGGVIAQERSVGNAIDDTTVWSRIKSAFLADGESSKLFTKIGVKVIEGRVLLTGTVSNPEERLKALKLVWSQEGVREVINEVKIENEGSLLKIIGGYAVDSFITAQIKSALLIGDNDIRSINYSIETINRVVYIIGIARSEEELDEVTKIAGTVKNVKQVVSYVRIKNSKIRGEMLKIND